MNHTADQLPVPLTFAPAAPVAPRRRKPVGVLVGLIAVAGAVVGFLAARGEDTTATPSATDGVAGGGSLTNAELSAAYTATFGVTADQATLDCVAREIGGAGSQAERLARGDEVLTLAEATEAFTPFMTCAADDDFLYLMVPAAVEALGGSADHACISEYFLTFGVAARAQARALAFVSTEDFTASLQATFAGCII